MSSGVAALEARLAQDLAWLELPAKDWVPPRTHAGRRVRDVVIVGAGMCGLAALAQIRLLGISNSLCIDAAPAGFEGPWETFARMRTLRSPKGLAGPALDLPALTFRAWFEAQFGIAAWEELDKIPKGRWMEYLRWYRRVLALPVENDTRLVGLAACGADLVELHLEGPEGGRTEYARRLVLATGRSGIGGGAVPEVLAGVDHKFWAHSADDIDFSQLKGRRVAVIGAGSSAMDNAATALEAGAARVDLLIRRATIPAINKLTGIGSPGTVYGLAALPDDWKLRFHGYAAETQVPPPRHSVLRVAAYPNAAFHLSCSLEGVAVEGGALVLETNRGSFHTDFVIAATGFRNDFLGRPEFSAIAPHILTWADAVALPEGFAPDGPFGTAPYLDPDFAFRERDPGACRALARIHCFNDAAMLSHGKVSGDIPAVSVGAARLGQALAAAFFVEDASIQFARVQAFETPELHGDEWSPAPELPQD